MPRRNGFTLLEILLAIMIGMLLLAIAVPSISGMMRDQKLKETFTKFDDFVRQVQQKSIERGQTLVMVWEEGGITVAILDPSNPDDRTADEHFSFDDGAKWSLQRPAALVKKPVWEWPFWKSGACEPVIVNYEGSGGTWSAEYSGLTGHGKLTDMIVK